MSAKEGLAMLVALRAQGEIDDLDLHFARLLDRLSGRSSSPLLLAAAAVSRATGEGHVCIDLERVLAMPGAQLAGPGETGPWRDALLASGVVGNPGEFRPLVLDASGRLYLWRYHDHEQRLARALAARATREVAVDEAVLGEGLARLFPEPPADGPDRQKLAAAMAVLKPLAVISGGPGTGKTTTVVRILALLVEQALAREPTLPPRIALAAPTGKAAARMQEAIAAALQRLPVSEAVRDALPTRAATLHRLLGVVPGCSRFRHHAGNPLAVDAVVVDEASMVDLALMARLLDAMPANARLVLLGDRDQLASVEAGAVLGELCAGAGACSEAFATRLRGIAGDAPAVAEAGTLAPLADCVMLLEHSYRFDAGSGIGRLARAVRGGDEAAALELLHETGRADVALLTPPAEGVTPALQARALEVMAPYLDLFAAGPAADPRAQLAAFAAARVLVAHREGSAGVRGANAAIEQALLADGRVVPRAAWYAGRPVMVTRNDYGLRLFNGDTGITLEAADGALRVYFDSGGEAAPRAVAPGRLPSHETVWAMTVHKAQGSEFDEVLLVLPDAPSPVLTRELLYTAVTRARERVTVLGSPTVLAAALGARVQRHSGLADALADAL